MDSSGPSESQATSGTAQDKAARRVRLKERYDTYAEYPLFVVSLMFIVGLVMIFDPGSTPEYQRIGRGLITISWLAFVFDYLVNLFLVDDRKKYVRTNLVELSAILFPPLRLLLIGRVLQTMASGAKRRLGDRVQIYALYLTTLTMVVGATFEVLFERQATNANIVSFGDGLWWTAETVSTVGYGDFYPVTIGGRIVAVLLFVNGIALLSAVTATVASKVLGSDQSSGGSEVTQPPTPPSASTDITIADLNDRIGRLEAQLSAIAFATGAQAAPPVQEQQP